MRQNAFADGAPLQTSVGKAHSADSNPLLHRFREMEMNMEEKGGKLG